MSLYRIYVYKKFYHYPSKNKLLEIMPYKYRWFTVCGYNIQFSRVMYSTKDFFIQKDFYVSFFKNFNYQRSFIVKYNYTYLLSTYLSLYLKQYTGVKLDWQFLNLKLTSEKVLMLKTWRVTYSKSFLKNFFMPSWTYFYFLIRIFMLRDISQFAAIVEKTIQKYPLKNHKRLFINASNLLKTYTKLANLDKQLLGFRLYFKGKLGRKGSVKKSIVYYSDGRISYTNKMLRYNYKYFLIPTETGVVGCYVAIFYNKNVYIYLHILNFIYFDVYFFF